MPIKWSISIVRRALNEDRVANAPSYSNLVKAIAAFRKGLTEVVTYGHVTVPLVYTQVSGLLLCFKTSYFGRLSTWLFTSTLAFPLWDANGCRCTNK